MPLQALLNEVEQLRQVCLRLDRLGNQNPPLTNQLAAICGHIRSSATLLEVLVTIKLERPGQA
jgi:hypothetical protein